MLEIKNLSIKFQRQIFSHVDFKASEGHIISISGKSGSGKTTLLKYIMGEYNCDGQLFYNQEEITKENRDDFLFHYVSYIDQEGQFFPNMTISQHFEFYGKLHEIDINQEDIMNYLKKVHLEHISIKQSPKQLSTGERKRFLISLALMMKKKIILLDEPTASIDRKNIIEFIEVLKELKEDMMCIISTHDHYILENSDVIYEIQEEKLIQTKEAEGIREEEKFIKKKPQKIKYRKYKNLKLKLISLCILLFGGITMIYISKSITQSITAQYHFTQMEQKRNRLYFAKLTDERHNIDGMYGILYDNYQYREELDLLNEEDIKVIKSIDGVKDIIPIDIFEKKYQSTPIDIYKNHTFMKRISTNACTDNVCMARDITVTAYYPEENIMKDGKKAEGTYINYVLEDMLGISSYDGISISFGADYTKGFYYSEYDDKKILNGVLEREKSVEIFIDGVLSEEEYHDGRLHGQGRIYMPYDKFKQFVEEAFPYEEDEERPLIPYEPKVYMITVEDGKDLDVKIELEKKSDLYYATSESLNSHAVQDHMKNQNQSVLLMTVMTSLGLVGALICLIIYSLYQRKEEMKLLQREGLSRNISKYFNNDNIILFIGWLLISLLGMVIMLWLFEVNRNYISIYFYIGYWIVTTLLLSVVIIFMKSMMVKRIVKKVCQYD